MVFMGVNSLKNNLTNPARVYLWEIILPSLIGGGDPVAITIRAQSASMPGRSVGEILVPYKATAGVKYPGKLTYSHTWDVTFIEGEDKRIFDAIHNWNQKIIDDFDGVGDGDDTIKADMLLNLLTTKGVPYNSYKLIGAYPQAVGDIALDYTTEAGVIFPVTFSYDSWETLGLGGL